MDRLLKIEFMARFGLLYCKQHLKAHVSFFYIRNRNKDGLYFQNETCLVLFYQNNVIREVLCAIFKLNVRVLAVCTQVSCLGVQCLIKIKQFFTNFSY